MASRCRIIADCLGVTFPRGQVALEDVSFESAAGSFVAIVGPSGCGKSTLLRSIGGLQSPTDGTLRLEPPADRSRVAFVFQDPTLLPWRSVVQNVALPLELRDAAEDEKTSQATTAIDRVGLAAADTRQSSRTCYRVECG
jgi:NitT/TauT family transport system ATP-binding protein